MRRWFVLACLIGACWRTEPPVAPSPPPDPTPAEPFRVAERGPDPDSFEDMMSKMGEFRDKMCVCSDKTCADAVTDEMTKWSVEMAKRADKSVKASTPTDDQMKEMTAVAQDLSKCMAAAMTAGSSTTTP
jgi:hypothetical protein